MAYFLTFYVDYWLNKPERLSETAQPYTGLRMHLAGRNRSTNTKPLNSLSERCAWPLPPPFATHALSGFLDMCLTLRLAGVVGLPLSLYCCPAAAASTGRPVKRLR